MADFLDNTAQTKEDPLRVERAFLVGVQTATMAAGEAEELLIELTELVENLGIGVVGSIIVKLRQPTPATLVGSGKVDEIIGEARLLECDVIVFDEGLSPAQQRNWERISELTVIDRQEVILDIFADRAQTREAVLQVALARMEYSMPRLTRAWTHLSRQRGKGAMSGEGETQLEQDRRIVRDRIARLKRELVEVQQHRGVQRQKRRRVPVPTAAIVGYTNAGKSSLLNALTGATVLAEDKLFATLDPTTRQLILPGNQKLLVTDTVGFVRRLPHGLVEAFKATLEEAIVSDFLIHVLDVTAPSVAEHRQTTLEVLGELDADSRPRLTVFNKVDAATPEQLHRARLLVPDALFVSAVSGEGLDELATHCTDLIRDTFGSAELLVPHDRYDVVARLHQVGHVQEEETLDEGVRLIGRYPPAQHGYFAPFVVTS
ncbi:GTPase HflX [Synoicihabitans lomoniglobus]|uniref:GTPase HflX n=1 Tax=Synoicihabitans lomoniglobus TaxID=2909285 RepID=A0AAF0CPX0_9BACT|nr:GTPase HflX [Opitutaceae bacterium LMO-M01]WED65883.1 GTPase HflX [Opitutaceae bacterium LMO-M01]